MTTYNAHVEMHNERGKVIRSCGTQGATLIGVMERVNDLITLYEPEDFHTMQLTVVREGEPS